MARLLQGLVVLFVASVLVFVLARLTGNPLIVMLPQDATEQERAIMARHLGLDQPLPVQYGIFISQAAKGDFGHSIYFRRPVMALILDRAPATFKLATTSVLASLMLGLPIGVLAAVRRDKWQDVIAKGIALLGQSMPTFWLGILLIQVFAVGLGWLPCSGYGGMQHYILPTIALGWYGAAGIARLTRSSMLDVLDSDYVRMARIKGVSERLVIWKHALRNALIPVVTFVGIIYGYLLMGSIVAETIFTWPGLGRLAYEAVIHRDFPLMQGVVIMFVGIFIVVNLAVDILYVYLDPRIRYVR